MMVSMFNVHVDKNLAISYRYTGVGWEISLYVCVYIKVIPWKFRILNPKNSRGISPWSL